MAGGRHLREPDRAPPSGRATGLLLSVVVMGMVAGAFILGTHQAPRPVAPVSHSVVRTECQIDTRGVRGAVEALHDAVVAHQAGRLSEAQFHRAVDGAIPKVADAVRDQQVTCRQVPGQAAPTQQGAP